MTAGGNGRGDAVDGLAIKFPDLWRSGTLEAVPVTLLSAVACGLLLAFSLPTLALLAVLPAAAFLVRDLVHVVRNRRIRRTWAGSFQSVNSPRKAVQALHESPGRYRLHVRSYGGFDAVRLAPCCVLEDVETGELSAVHPASWRVMEYALESKTEVVQHRS